MVNIKSVKKITVTEQIMEQIAQLIRTGDLKPGQQLPPERDLAERLGVTRGRVREALRALSLVGLITIKAGEGSFVNEQQAPIQPETIVWMFHHELDNLDEIYAARKLIETEVYVSAARHAASEQLLPLEAMIDKLQLLVREGASEPFLDELDRFDLHVGDICGNRIYAKLIQTIIYLRRESSLKLLHVPGAMENSLNSRRTMLEAMQSNDSERVLQAMNQFFSVSRTFYENIGATSAENSSTADIGDSQ